MTMAIGRTHLDLIAAIEPETIKNALDRDGFWVTPRLIDAESCADLGRLYTAGEDRFRSTVTMAKHGFGRGEYKYFARPLPEPVTALRRALYGRLAPVANAWNFRWGRCEEWPAEHEFLESRCAAAGQTRPTPLLLRY